MGVDDCGALPRWICLIEGMESDVLRLDAGQLRFSPVGLTSAFYYLVSKQLDSESRIYRRIRASRTEVPFA